MKRDMDLVRQILLTVEKDGPQPSGLELSIGGFETESVMEHIRLLTEAGYLDSIDCCTMSGPDWRPMRLTWAGHDFLDAARSDTVWKKAKEKLAGIGSGASMEVMKALLMFLAKQQLGLPD